MLTTSPGLLAFLKLFFCPFVRCGFRCALPYAQPGQVGKSTDAKSLGIIPARARFRSLGKEIWPSLSWIVARRDCFLFIEMIEGSSAWILVCAGPNSTGRG